MPRAIEPPTATEVTSAHVSNADAIRNAISLGGDSDTMACIAGAIAEAYYGSVPAVIQTAVFARLVPALVKMLEAFAMKNVAYMPHIKIP